MKKLLFSSLAIASMFSFISCERHTWEDSSEGAKDGTKNLFPKPESNAGAKHEGHGAHAEHENQADHATEPKQETGTKVQAEDHSAHGH